VLNNQALSGAMSDLTVFILTHNEEVHIERCIRSVIPLAAKVNVIDSFSSDRTVEIARSLGAEVTQHEFLHHAHQMNWALDNIPVKTTWVMRVDADEYLEQDLIAEIPSLLPDLPADVGGIYLRRKTLFNGKWIRYGGFYPHILLRIWRTGSGRMENRWQDAHAVLPPGTKTFMANGHLVDDNHKGISFWIEKHNRYASREALDHLNLKYGLFTQDESLKLIQDSQARRKRIVKEEFYYGLPLVMRAGMYFLYRYLFRFGFLDGRVGFIYHFLQAFWYRLLVDIKIMELEARSHGDVEELKRLIKKQHGLSV
jgi:glycosyltransferase involved in cell wall biosynthesis